MSSSTSPDIELPWQYQFPPFFTLQPHAETRARQIAAWRSLILDWYGATHQGIVDAKEASRHPPFANSVLNRHLSEEGVTVVMEELVRTGHAEQLDKGSRWIVFCGKTLQEWAECIYSWARNAGMTGSVCTLFELTDGDDTKEEDFHGLSSETLVRALKKLEASSRAELIMFDDNQGVKFF